MPKHEVIIAGMGPTGTALAALLGQRGLRVAIVDKLPDLYPLPRAVGLDHEAMRLVQELGLAEAVAPHVALYRRTVYLGMDGEPIKKLDTVPPPWPLAWAPNYVFDQPAFERVLRQRVAQLPNVEVLLETEIIATGQDAEGAWADVRPVGGTEVQRLQAKYLVACDGGGSPIRERLGIQLEDLGFDEPWLVVDAIVPDAKLAQLPQTQVQYCEAQRPATFVVGPGNHRRWEIMLNPGDSVATKKYPDEELWPLLERWIKPGEVQLWRSAAYRFHSLVAREWRRGRILLAGDAAHMTPPFMAQGMCQGLRDAANLAWKLDAVLRRGSPDALLDSYGEERRPHVLTTTQRAIELGRVICERDPARAVERDRRLREEQGGEIRTMYRQLMIPSLVSGLGDFATPGAGQLAPQPEVVCDGFEGRLDDLTGSGFTLLVRGALAAPEEAALRQALAALGGTLVHVVDAATAQAREPGFVRVHERQPVIAPWLEGLGQGCALVRPDHYVYGTAADAVAGLRLLVQLQAALAAPPACGRRDAAPA